MKHPIAVAFAVAVVLTLALVGLAYAIYPAQQAPWPMALAMAAFPFIWFFAWLITNAMGWWRDTTKGAERDDP
ncbi:hypothetical protein [Usitatibacter palustris]|uniref:DUF2842 domain-containing protein n=1 Tax=Usitatibacter palustris TaxID=2732487 RepID=A0A6M4H2L4_9PROT|nr:hypothetical protein [Usitatibacter palustris]QJR13572.1 hypothetical protein DSM104440_00356 [Usitatibacter palustris]